MYYVVRGGGSYYRGMDIRGILWVSRRECLRFQAWENAHACATTLRSLHHQSCQVVAVREPGDPA